MNLIKQLREEYYTEIESIEQECEDRDLDIDVDFDVDPIKERIAMMEFCLELSDNLIKIGIEIKDVDFSSVSEAVYLDAYNGKNFVKVRIASHSSNYDKDANIEMSRFKNYSRYDLSQAIKQVTSKF